MLRISGITIPDNKRLEIGLTAIYGIGRNRAKSILNNLKIEHGRRPAELSAGEENDIRKAVEIFKIEGDLKREVSGNIKRLKDIKSYVGIRHTRGLPVRGQRTKTNARTRKGPKKTMGSGKKKVDKK
ncbi:MAG: 30S ribosomal protein S13 [Candidatus Vogelbacteria bacterium RIFOXYD1_FULL_44_32]|uniref:Small ribosomal subunit protein uS13 n=1 Tax=Candidatus Vogelbacteria bacterium RIFOXYD1_FULL_44_32 TaxID=1802438 RepID=A0A1G2QDK2_9BACT|nr:MAG: 30S ribosomal protein S13 [Candidatus Vogelbacteria bacterium RIFOXYD1_FULL_44_32]